MQLDETLREIDPRIKSYSIRVPQIEQRLLDGRYTNQVCHYVVSLGGQSSPTDPIAEIATVEAESSYGPLGGIAITINSLQQHIGGQFADEIIEKAAKRVIYNWKQRYESSKRTVPRVVQDWADSKADNPTYRYEGVVPDGTTGNMRLDCIPAANATIKSASMTMEVVRDELAGYFVGLSPLDGDVVWLGIGLLPFTDYADSATLLDDDEGFGGS